jgi:hypothetical protein
MTRLAADSARAVYFEGGGEAGGENSTMGWEHGQLLVSGVCQSQTGA